VKVRWFGQSAFLLEGPPRVFIDPFGPMPGLAASGRRFDYPPIADVEADLLLVTHEHRDHNAVDAVGGEPHLAGTKRGHNVMFRFALGGLRFAHLGDLGQDALRPGQVRALGTVDVLFVPTGGGPTIGREASADVVRALRPRLVLPMHLGNALVDFLEPPDAFVAALGARVLEADASEADLEAHLGTPDDPVVLLLRPPGA